jgi:thiamine-monophosphate kinase
MKPAQVRWLVKRHHRPSARIAEGLWLVERGLATAAIDVSDGLSGDLHHLCEESGVGADIMTASLPLSRACRAYAAARHLDPQQIALQGGEDYELLFTVPSRQQSRFERLAATTPFGFTCIGSITTPRSGLRLCTDKGETKPLPITSYEHFFKQSP